MIIKGGMIVAAPMGDPNASIPTPQPVHYRHMFGSLGKARNATRMTFLSGAALEAGIAEQLKLASMIGKVSNCRNVTKASMILNDYQPEITVNAQTYEVHADGELLVCEPSSELPLTQKYFLF
jgi:urease subunit alpha